MLMNKISGKSKVVNEEDQGRDVKMLKNRIQAINGILMHDGLIEDIKEILEKIDLIRAFPDNDKTTREKFIKEYQECSDKKSKEEFLRKNI